MKMTELKKHIENLPDELKTSILALIEFKTDSDMEKALDRMTAIKQELENRMTGIKRELESRMTGIEERLEIKMTGIEERLDSKISTVLWTVGVGFTLMLVLLSVFQFVK